MTRARTVDARFEQRSSGREHGEDCALQSPFEVCGFAPTQSNGLPLALALAASLTAHLAAVVAWPSVTLPARVATHSAVAVALVPVNAARVDAATSPPQDVAPAPQEQAHTAQPSTPPRAVPDTLREPARLANARVAESSRPPPSETVAVPPRQAAQTDEVISEDPAQPSAADVASTEPAPSDTPPRASETEAKPHKVPKPDKAKPHKVPATEPRVVEQPQKVAAPEGQAVHRSPTDAHVDAKPVSDNPPPRYPRTARRRGHEGRVVLRVSIGADGAPDALGVIESSGHQNLDRAALTAVRAWRFEPARQDGRRVSSRVDVPVVFELETRN